ncbi:MAG: oxidoreductase [SAR324 cluster bacterium]|nr:oxidoreductase [SAR324 cluster bacterium]
MTQAILVGGSGLVGQECLKYLLQHSAYENIILLLRKPLNVNNPKVKEHLIDFDHLDSCQDLIRGDDLFCCLGTTIKQAGSQEAFKRVDHDYPLQIARIAQKNGVNHCAIVTALGANKSSAVFYNRVKGEVEAGLSEIPFTSLHFFRPSLLLGNRNEFRIGEEIGKYAMPLFTSFLPRKLRKYRPIQADTVAFAMVHMAQKADHLARYAFESNEIQKIYDDNH